MNQGSQGSGAIVISIILLCVLGVYYGGDRIMAWWEAHEKSDAKSQKEQSAFWTIADKVMGKNAPQKSAAPLTQAVAEKPAATPTVHEPVAAAQALYPSYGTLRNGVSYYDSEQDGHAVGRYPAGAEIDIIEWPQESLYALVSYNGFSGWVSKGLIGNLQDLHGKEWIKK